MSLLKIVVTAFWDDEASVWVASSDDVKGLATEAETVELLDQKLKVMIPELLHANHSIQNMQIPYYLHADREQYLSV